MAISIQDFINQAVTAQAPQNAPNTALQSFFSSPTHNLIYGQNASHQATSAANSGTYDPVNAFRADPGYEFAQQEAFRKMQQYGASKGILNSGPMQLELQRQAQGMADQNYQRFIGQQQAMFSDNQNRLQGLMQMGMGQTGSDQGLAINQLLAQIAAQGNLSTGQNIGQNYMSGASDIASLLANLGTSNANAFLNTGAAQANNIFQGNNFAAQIQAQQQAMRNQQQNSIMAGQGAAAGYGQPMFSGKYF